MPLYMFQGRYSTNSIKSLIENPDLRTRMGAAGKVRAKQLYDWQAVIPRYQALWGDMNARRERGIPTSPREGVEAGNPAGIDPFRLYAGYPSDTITNAAVISADQALTGEQVKTLVELTGAAALRRLVNSQDNIVAISALVFHEGPIRLDELTAKSGLTPAVAEGVVLWLAKYDQVRISV